MVLRPNIKEQIMSMDKFIEVLLYAVPSLITGGVAYYLFDSYFKDQQHILLNLIMQAATNKAYNRKITSCTKCLIVLKIITNAN
jgi:hypothetical protein